MSKSQNLIPVIDSHHHLWDMEDNPYPGLQNPSDDTHLGDYRSICKNYLIDDFLEDLQGLNVTKSVHIEAGWESDDCQAETRWLQKISIQHGFPTGIVPNVDLFADDAEHQIETLASYPNVRGIRSRFLTPAELANLPNQSIENPLANKNWRNAFQKLDTHNLSFDLQAPPLLMPMAADIAKAFPETRFVLTHAGLPLDRSVDGIQIWKKGMRTLAALDNVYVKISGLGMTDWKWTQNSFRPIIMDTIDIFGPSRCMFGSNFPVDSLYATYYRLLSSIRSIISDLSEEEQQQILNKTASIFYRI